MSSKKKADYIMKSKNRAAQDPSFFTSQRSADDKRSGGECFSAMGEK